jgi:hypothetical protein
VKRGSPALQFAQNNIRKSRKATRGPIWRLRANAAYCIAPKRLLKELDGTIG